MRIPTGTARGKGFGSRMVQLSSTTVSRRHTRRSLLIFDGSPLASLYLLVAFRRMPLRRMFLYIRSYPVFSVDSKNVSRPAQALCLAFIFNLVCSCFSEQRKRRINRKLWWGRRRCIWLHDHRCTAKSMHQLGSTILAQDRCTYRPSSNSCRSNRRMGSPGINLELHTGRRGKVFQS